MLGRGSRTVNFCRGVNFAFAKRAGSTSVNNAIFARLECDLLLFPREHEKTRVWVEVGGTSTWQRARTSQTRVTSPCTGAGASITAASTSRASPRSILYLRVPFVEVHTLRSYHPQRPWFSVRTSNFHSVALCLRYRSVCNVVVSWLREDRCNHVERDCDAGGVGFSVSRWSRYTEAD